MEETPKVEYINCNRGGYHFGEVLNMVCLEQQCIDQQLCCCACVEQTHKEHNTKPLRLVMLEASKAIVGVKPVQFNIDITLELINIHLKNSMENFSKFKKTINNSLQQIENSIVGYYSFLVEQVKLKNIDPKFQIQRLFNLVRTNCSNTSQYSEAVRKITGLIGVKKDQGQLNQEDIVNSLKISNEDMQKELLANMQEVSKKLNSYEKTLNQTSKSVDIWKCGAFKFSPTFKHPDIKLVSDLIVKSANNSGYKFAIMEPHLQNGGVKQFAFNIKECGSNWVAVGMCHKNVVASKNYGFNFSSIGHGAYMVSANGGSWSHTKVQHNNSVKAFKFGKGDIISMKVNFIQKTAMFKKNSQTYSIPFQTIAKDELSPCVLFYYLNDEVEFLQNHKY